MPSLKRDLPINTLASSQIPESIKSCNVCAPPSIMTEFILCLNNLLQILCMFDSVTLIVLASWLNTQSESESLSSLSKTTRTGLFPFQSRVVSFGLSSLAVFEPIKIACSLARHL